MSQDYDRTQMGATFDLLPLVPALVLHDASAAICIRCRHLNAEAKALRAEP